MQGLRLQTCAEGTEEEMPENLLTEASLEADGWPHRWNLQCLTEVKRSPVTDHLLQCGTPPATLPRMVTNPSATSQPDHLLALASCLSQLSDLYHSQKAFPADSAHY